MKLIGIPVSTSKPQYYINQAYADYVSGAGMIPLLLTPSMNNEALEVIVNGCDGLLLPGGGDMEPTYYGEDNIASYSVDLDKDNFERSLYDRFLKAAKPIFGICRGLQLIMREVLAENPKLEKNFTYFQHMNEHSIVNDLKIPRTVTSHSVNIKNSLYGKNNKGKDIIFVNSMHHQCVVMNKRLKIANDMVEVLATTDRGISRKESVNFAVVEAIRLSNIASDVMAVQWHPEELRDYALIQNFFGVNKKDYKVKEAVK